MEPKSAIPPVTRIKRGDCEAFNELCGRYYAAMVSYARLFLDDQWAEDVVQDVFYNVWQNREKLDDTNSLYKYILRAVYNQSLNYIKKNKYAREYRSHYQEKIESISHVYYHPDNSPIIENLYNQDIRENINKAVDALPPKCREVFRLSYIEDMSNKEISGKLGITLSTVENHIYLALKQLRSALSKERLLTLLLLLFMAE